MKSRFPEIVLCLVTFVWGGTFLATRIALQETGPFALVACRFAIATLVVAGFVRQRPNRAEMTAGFLIGLSMVAGYLLQASGLCFTTSSKSAFITALYVPIVPLLQIPITGLRPGRWIWIGVALSFTGMACLSMQGGFNLHIGIGEWLTLGCAVASAFQILLIGRFAKTGDTTRITAVQLGVVSLGATILVPFESPVHMGVHAAAIAMVLGLVATAAVLWAMNWAQKSVNPARATLIYSMEPVWAALVGATAGEKLPAIGIAGGALVLLGILAAELGPSVRRRSRRREATACTILPEELVASCF